MRACYISGPMRSKPQFNYPAFFAAEEQLRAAGWVVYNPARIVAAEVDPVPLDLTVEQQRSGTTPAACRQYAKRELLIIVESLKAEDGDAIVLIDDWETSAGARAEVAAAQWVGLRVLTLEQALRGVC